MPEMRLTPARLRVLRLLAQGAKLKWKQGANAFYVCRGAEFYDERLRESVVLNLQHDGYIDSSYRITTLGRDAVRQSEVKA